MNNLNKFVFIILSEIKAILNFFNITAKLSNSYGAKLVALNMYTKLISI